ncbi:MAG TPA: MoaD/ThiS family protein [Acidimicrobiales bacterium]|nr:MoaD/ThiS family protein [Acidimicrobiales bacterium]
MAQLRFFGPLRDVTKTSSLEIEAGTVDDAVATAVNLFGDDFAKIMKRSRVWVNGEQSEGTRVLLQNDEVAILPPVSGG